MLTRICSGLWKVLEQTINQFLVELVIFRRDSTGFWLFIVREGSFTIGVWCELLTQTTTVRTR